MFLMGIGSVTTLSSEIMYKRKAKSCFGCKALCSLAHRQGCTLGFPVKKKRVGEGTDQRVLREPLKWCPKPTNNVQFQIAFNQLNK